MNKLFSILILVPIGTTLLWGQSETGAKPQNIELAQGWELQDIAKISDKGEQISQPSYPAANWLQATVPGTVLTSLVNDKVYPEPLYGENNRPEKIPESLCHTSYWYRTYFYCTSSLCG